MRTAALLDFIRRELAPTPGRGGATFRLTLACLAATIPVLTHRIPHALIVMIVMYLITREDTATTLLGSILGVVGVTVGLGSALLALRISIDVQWLRFGFVITFLFVGLFLKRVLTIDGLGSAIGLPAALAMILPDILRTRPPEVLVEFILWCWWCVVLGLSVNIAVQLLLSPGDPLVLLRRELDTRLVAVETTLRRLAGEQTMEHAGASLRPLGIAGMSRSLVLLKTASIIHRWARMRHETLATLITLTDRLVTAALVLETVAAASAGRIDRERLLRIANGCDRTRRAFEELRLPEPGEWAVPADEQNTELSSLLLDMERTLDQIALAVPRQSNVSVQTEHGPGEKRSLFIPDAFDNPEYVRFAVKGSLAALICYVCFIGFDYPGIYTSVITCFVVSLSTIGASNQKGVLRFGGAAVGGLMGIIALVYLFPNMDTIGGFWLVFGAGTAVAAWLNFGTPRISYGGYQTGLAFYKATLQSFGPATIVLGVGGVESVATVVRDRLIGVFFGLIVFGTIEHVLWPVRAADRMRKRLTDMLHSLAGLALVCSGGESAADIDARRRLISQQVGDVQGFIESSKFEPGAASPEEIERHTGDAQSVFLVLLALARDESGSAALPDAFRVQMIQVDNEVSKVLTAVAERIRSREAVPPFDFGEALGEIESRVTVLVELGRDANKACRGRLALYRELVAAVKRLALGTIPMQSASWPRP